MARKSGDIGGVIPLSAVDHQLSDSLLGEKARVNAVELGKIALSHNVTPAKAGVLQKHPEKTGFRLEFAPYPIRGRNDAHGLIIEVPRLNSTVLTSILSLGMVDRRFIRPVFAHFGYSFM